MCEHHRCPDPVEVCEEASLLILSHRLDERAARLQVQIDELESRTGALERQQQDVARRERERGELTERMEV